MLKLVLLLEKELFDIITHSFYDGGNNIVNERQIKDKPIVLDTTLQKVDDVKVKKNCCGKGKKNEKN